jgi:pimeloyl-ACP methyl ester carboxylesterase
MLPLRKAHHMVAGPQVFISYQRTDTDFARQVRAHLAAASVPTWMDQFDIPIGAYWPDEIDQGLAASEIVVGILSPEAMTSRNVKNEWDWAIQNDKRLLLVKVEPTVIPHRYVSINFIDATGVHRNDALAGLLTALGIETQPAPEAIPTTSYAQSEDVNIAYQVFGSGPVELVVTPGFVSNIDLMWDDPLNARYWRCLASFARVITFDKRGTGLSDRVTEIPSLEQRVDDLRAVMDAAGVYQAALMGVSEGGPLSVQFAATYPERTRALILYGADVRTLWASDFPWGAHEAAYDAEEAHILQTWGSDASDSIASFAPSKAHDASFIAWFTRYFRSSASPSAAVSLHRMNRSIDVRSLLGHLDVPTLVVHRAGDRAGSVEIGRYLAASIPGAVLSELPGEDHLPYLGDQDAIIDAVQAFLAHLPGSTSTDMSIDA